MEANDISPAVVNRLPRYYRYLGELLDKKVDRISSSELSSLMNTTASLIRQDFNNFGGFGQQGYGYNVATLREEIGKILGIDERHNVIVIGAGHLGQAIANYKGFNKSGFYITGLFDIKPELDGKKVGDVNIHHLNYLADFLSENKVDIAAITTPKTVVDEIVRILLRYDVRAVWNFSHADLTSYEDLVVENVHLSESIMKLSYNIKWNENNSN